MDNVDWQAAFATISDLEFVAQLALGFVNVTAIPYICAVLMRLLMDWMRDVG